MLFTKKDKAGELPEQLEETDDSSVDESILTENDESDDAAETEETERLKETVSSDHVVSEGFILEKSEDGDDGAVFYRDENPIKDAPEDVNVYEIDDSDCLWNYVNKISIQGRLYFSGKLKVDETNFTKNMPEDRPKIRVASFNLLIQKSTKNGIKKHWIFIKTYNNKLIEWLQEQSCGTWIRVEGRLESARRNTYVNATSITAFSEAHMKAIFSDGRNESSVDWQEAEKALSETGGGLNNDEARNKIKQIKNQVRTMETQANTISMEDEDNMDSPQAMVMAGGELKPEEIEEIRRNTSRFLIYSDDDDEGFDDLKPVPSEDDDDFEDLDEEDNDDEEEYEYIREKERDLRYAEPGLLKPGVSYMPPEFPGVPSRELDAEKIIMQERIDSMMRKERELAERERILREEEERIARESVARQAATVRDEPRDIFADEAEEKYPPIPVRIKPVLRERSVPISPISEEKPRILRGLRPVKKTKEEKNSFKSRFD